MTSNSTFHFSMDSHPTHILCTQAIVYHHKETRVMSRADIGKMVKCGPGPLTSIVYIVHGFLKVIIVLQWLMPLQSGLGQLVECRRLVSRDRHPRMQSRTSDFGYRSIEMTRVKETEAY